MIDISVIIPAKNEEKRIKSTLVRYSDFLRGKKKKFEILVVINNTTDETAEVINELMKKYKEISYINFDAPIGKGGALLEGFNVVKGNLITYTDADGSTSPETLYDLSLKINDYDGIIGSRWLKDSKILKKQPILRRIASRGFNLLTRTILGLKYKDTQCPAKVFKKNVIDKIKDKIEPTNFAIDAVLLYHMKKESFNIKEEPITWEDKDFSTLRMRKVIPSMLLTILKTRLKK